MENNKVIYIRLSSIILFIITIIIVGLLIMSYMCKNIVLYGMEFNRKDKIIDLSNANINNVSELVNNLDLFKNVETVDFGEQFILYEDKQMLMEEYPNINFKVNIYYNIYGKKVFENEKILDLSDVKVDDKLEELLDKLPKLEEVNLYNNTLTKDEQIDLQKKFPKIVFKWKVEVLSKEVDYDIEKLDFTNQKINDLDDFRKSLTLLKKLKTLDMSNTNLSNEQLGKLREEFPNTRIDWVVHLGKWSLRTDAVSFSVLIYKYDYKRMTSEDIQVLKYCTELQALDLGHQEITDISVIGEYLPNLRVLILADNKITDITPISKLKHLHYLELFINDVTDLSPLISCTELVDLNLCYNFNLRDLEPIMQLPLMERLWLVGVTVSSSNRQLLKQRYPNATIVIEGKGSTNNGWRTHDRYYKMIDMFHNNYISDVFLKYDNR